MRTRIKARLLASAFYLLLVFVIWVAIVQAAGGMGMGTGGID